MAATATETTKQKAPKSIVTTRLTASGIKHALAKSAQDRLDGICDLIALLAKVPAWADKANAALEAVGVLADETRDASR